MIIPVILAGGSGTRLWPMSREMFPKQLLKLDGPHTMLQQTMMRIKDVPQMAPPMVICNEKHRYPISDQLQRIDSPPSDMILEPMGKNTAPAIAVAAMKAKENNPDSLLLILPADHVIRDVAAFHQALLKAAEFAARGYLITFGVVPESPETGYGYIRKGAPLEASPAGAESAAVYGIDEFVEKPDRQTAESYLASGEYCWNSGMFMFQSSNVYSELEKFVPDIVSACRDAYQQGRSDGEALYLEASAFGRCPSDSIDYAVMEKTALGGMVPFQAGWSDLGSWEALWTLGEKDMDGNVISGEVMARQIKNNIVFSGQRLVAVLGIENSVIVDTADALLVTTRERAQDVKSVVSALKAENRKEAASHAMVFQPWGMVTELASESDCTIRRITIHPGKRLGFRGPAGHTLQWTVISGKGRITADGAPKDVPADQSIQIKPECPIEIHNTHHAPLVIVEVCLPGSGGEHLTAGK